MNTQPEALRLADALLKAPGSGHVTRYCDDAAAELRRLHAENERLNKAIQYEQHLAGRIGTHGPGCELWGPAHYECLVRAHEAIKVQRDGLLTALEKMNRAYVGLLEIGRDRILSLGGGCDPVDVMERYDLNLLESRAAIASVKDAA